MEGNRAEPGLDWRDGNLPVSRRYGDIYYSASDGLAESRHVFLAGNDLPRRWPGAGAFTIGELGFGTGLNFLAAWELWQTLAAPGARLRYTAFEIAPLGPREMARALSRWPSLSDRAGELLAAWADPLPDGAAIELPGVRLELAIGDARTAVPRWRGAADAWFLDGFAPAKNPELWEAGLLAAVFDRTRPGGSVATYSAAGVVRGNLAAAGFRVLKRPGFGTKRDMIVGHRPCAS